jgi:hypothetical protein
MAYGAVTKQATEERRAQFFAARNSVTMTPLRPTPKAASSVPPQ